VRIDRDLTDTAPPEWRDRIDQLMIPGAAGFQELAMFHRASRTLILVDLVQNMAPSVVPPRYRRLARVLGMARHDGRPPVYLRWLVRLGGAEARAAGTRLLAWAPDRVVFAHGDCFEQDGTAELRRVLEWLVGPTPERGGATSRG
jgi:hypothetical protein